EGAWRPESLGASGATWRERRRPRRRDGAEQKLQLVVHALRPVVQAHGVPELTRGIDQDDAAEALAGGRQHGRPAGFPPAEGEHRLAINRLDPAFARPAAP